MLLRKYFSLLCSPSVTHVHTEPDQTASVAAACCWWVAEAALIILLFANALQSQRIDTYSSSVGDTARKVEADKAGETL